MLSVPANPGGGRVQTLSNRAPNRSMQPLVVTTGVADPDGMNHWWTYEEDAVAGVGKYMVNIANGNLITQSDDMTVSNKGIELAFRRTYNSMSNHSYANGDGSTPSLYGDKWTNTFDAHIAYNDFSAVNGQKGVSLYDIDGARYDYAPAGDLHSFLPPAGQFAVLYYDGTGYSWTKKTGTVYYFWDLNQPTLPALAGLIETIYGRNHNNYLSFARTFSPDASKLTNLVNMTITAEDGLVATLAYGDVSQNGSPNYRVLSSLTWPDSSTTVSYGYTIQFQGSTPVGPTLTQVTSPGNGSTASSKLNEQYNYSAGTAFMTNVYAPRYYCSHHSDCNSTQNPLQTGPAYTFSYGTANVLSQVGYYGDVNPNIIEPSGYGSGYLQPSATHDLGSTTPYRTVSLSYSTGSTTWSDSDGHQTAYAFDSIGRVTQTTDTTGDPSGGVSTLVKTMGWDSLNDLISSNDARSNETDYAYDNNGNTIAVGLPAAPTNVNGTIVSMRATSLYSYDANNNVTSYCDPVWVHQNGKDWISRPASSDSLCPGGSGTTIMTWTNPGSYEPFGELTKLTKPLGYVSTLAYSTTSQGGADYGLPTSVTGTNFTQADGTNVTPSQSFVYDAHGNVVCYSNGAGTWILQYDNLNRRTAVGDPDDASLTSSACSKTPGLPGSHIQTTAVYLANGQVSSTQTPSEYQAGVSTSYTYDADGNTLTEVKHFSGVSGTTAKLYDGGDRLVEVDNPYDTRTFGGVGYDFYSYPWMTRYFYDLSMGGTVSVGSVNGVKAYGNLYKTQEFVSVWGAAAAWIDLKGNGFDALDRATAKYAYQPVKNGDSEVSWTSTFDGSSATLGLLTQTVDPRGNTTSYQYDALDRATNVNFPAGPDIPNAGSRTYTFDPDGRTASIASSVLGTQSYGYDVDGRLTSESEPTYSGATSPATLTYGYYANGWKQSLSVTSSALTKANLFQYAFRVDGLKDWEKVSYGSNPSTISTTYTSGGRTTSSQDPYATASYSYLTSGQLASHTLRGSGQIYSLTGFTYDPENEPLSNGASYAYNVRGELISSSASTTLYYRGQNGYMHPRRYGTLNGVHYWSDDGVNLDSQNGAMLTDSSVFGGGAGPWTYDQDARQITDSECFQYHFGKFFDCFSGTSTRSFDSENHLQSLSSSSWGIPNACDAGSFFGQTYYNTSVSDSRTYYWGPNQHPMLISVYTTVGSKQLHVAHTLHWDGDTLLFTTNASGQLDDLKIGSVGDFTPLDPSYGGLTIWDRDSNGTTFSAHNANGGSGGLIFSNPAQVQTCYFIQIGPTSFNWIATPNSSGGLTTAEAGLVSEIRTDGIYDGISQIQGTRTYTDSSQSWTTPDAYAGEVHDPASQKPYMWNRNNAVLYTDPTGFLIGKVDTYLNGVIHDMLQGSSTFRTLWRTISKDADHVYNFRYKETGYPGLFDPRAGRQVYIDVKPGTKETSLLENILAHEVGHAHDLTAGTYAKNQGDHSLNCRPQECNREEMVGGVFYQYLVTNELKINFNSGYSLPLQDAPGGGVTHSDTLASNENLNAVGELIGGLGNDPNYDPLSGYGGGGGRQVNQQ